MLKVKYIDIIICMIILTAAKTGPKISNLNFFGHVFLKIRFIQIQSIHTFSFYDTYNFHSFLYLNKFQIFCF